MSASVRFARSLSDALAFAPDISRRGPPGYTPAMRSIANVALLLPVLTLSGRGADIMIPMAIPVFGGMVAALLTLFTVPVLYCWREEKRLAREG